MILETMVMVHVFDGWGPPASQLIIEGTSRRHKQASRAAKRRRTSTGEEAPNMYVDAIVLLLSGLYRSCAL